MKPAHVLLTLLLALSLGTAPVHAQTAFNGSTANINPGPTDCCKDLEVKIQNQPSTPGGASPIPLATFGNASSCGPQVTSHESNPRSAQTIPPISKTGVVSVCVNVNSKSTSPITCKLVMTSLLDKGLSHEKTCTLPPSDGNSETNESVDLTFDLCSNDLRVSEDWVLRVYCSDKQTLCLERRVTIDKKCDRGCGECDGSSAEPTASQNPDQCLAFPTTKSDGGMTDGALIYDAPGFDFAGRKGLFANVPSTCPVAKDSSGQISQIQNGASTMEIADVTGEQAFTVTHKDLSGAVFRTSKVSKVAASGGDCLRMDSTYEGVTRRSEQTQLSPGKTLLQKGKLNGTDFEPLWRETLAVTTVSPGIVKHRRTVEQRASVSQAWCTSSDIESTWEKQVYDWVQTKEVLDPIGAALTTTWSYYQPGEITGAEGSTEGVGRLKRAVRPDGYEVFHTYNKFGATMTTPYAGTMAGRTTTATWDPATQAETCETKAGNQTLAKEVTSHTPTTETRTVYTSAGESLSSTTTYLPCGVDFGGKPTNALRHDGTLTTLAYTRHQGGGCSTATETGATNDGVAVCEGTRSTTTKNSRGTTILSKNESIGYNMDSAILASTAVTSVDNLGRALTIAHNSPSPSVTVTNEVAIAPGAAWTTKTTYSCCGVAKEIDKYGIPTFHAYDSLQRQIKTNRLGVTTETVRKGLTTETHRYQESVDESLSPASYASAANLVSRSVTNLTGTIDESWSPDPTPDTRPDPINDPPRPLIKSSSTATTYPIFSTLIRKALILNVL